MLNRCAGISGTFVLVVNVSDKLYTLHFVAFIIIVSIISGMFPVIVSVFDNIDTRLHFQYLYMLNHCV